MRAAIIIPARLHSTRLPDKLLLSETGLPLICHTVERAIEIRDRSEGMFREVVVATDDRRIARVVERYAAERGHGVAARMTSPDHQSGSDRIAEAAGDLGPDVDAVLNLQGDEPEAPVAAILELAAFYRETSPDIATLVYPVAEGRDRENPDLVKVVLGRGGRALYFSRADIPYRREDGDFSPPSYGHVGVYLYRRASLERFVALPASPLERTEKLEQLRALEEGMTIAAHILAERPPKGIDTPEDYRAFVDGRRVSGMHNS